MISKRFTVDGSPALEQHLETVCDQVRDAVLNLIPSWKLDGILLGGGYGRGEGGVLRTTEGDRPYNDLEFYVFVRGMALLAERKYRGPLHELGEKLTPIAGIEVEFKVLTLEKVRRSRPSMFYYDLAVGHRVLFGDENHIGMGLASHRRSASQIPLHEATRLLMNRCSGLLFSLERLERADFGPQEADYVGRNLAKLQLALGDVVLTAHGKYHWSCLERHQRLLKISPRDDLPFLAKVQTHHSAGVEFKLHPVRTTSGREELKSHHQGLSGIAMQVWLWLENRRLGTQFKHTSDYARSKVDKCPEQPAWRNRLVQSRDRNVAGVLSGRYPRQSLLHALSLMLWDDHILSEGPLDGQLQHELRTSAVTLKDLVAAYERLWHRYH